jgi:hypothetical protein
MDTSSSGILYVTSQEQPRSEREDSGTNPNIFQISRLPSPTKYYEYQATDSEEPSWLSICEYNDASKLSAQNELLETKSPAHTSSERFVYYHVSSRQSPQVKIEALRPNEVVLVAVTMTLQDVDNGEIQFDRWYEEEHIDLLSKVPGWFRTRRFKSSSASKRSDVTYLALHEYHSTHGLGGTEHRAAMSTSWRNDIMNTYVKDKFRRTYQLQRAGEHI